MIKHEELKKKLVIAIKSNNEEEKNNIRIVLGELDRISKTPSDDDVIKTVKKLERLELERLTYTSENTNPYLSFLQSLLPKQISEQEVKVWILNNIDFSLLRNQMQAVGMTVKHFGASVDGSLVKSIIESL